MARSEPHWQRSRKERERQRKEAEEARLLDRLDRQLCYVYEVDEKDGEFIWSKWDAEIAAKRTARWLVNDPDLWEPFVRPSLKSGHASRMLELMVAELAARCRFDSIFGPDARGTAIADVFSPEFEALSWGPPLIDWLVDRAAAGLRRAGADPGRLVWRDLCIALAVGDIVKVGLRPESSDARVPSACRLVADHVNLSKSTVYTRSWRKIKKMERSRAHQRSRLPGS